ncbi:MAG: SDR family oxidoreductase [Nanoarchaeota archaeon]
MKVVVFGATGRVGNEVVEECLRKGFEVVAFSRKPKINPRKNLSVVIGDALNPTAVDKAVEGCDCAIITLRVEPREIRDIISASTANIVSAMLRKKAKRLICLTAMGVGESIKEVPFFIRPVFTVYMGRSFKDKHRQEQLIEASNLDWTIVRPSFFTNGPVRGNLIVGEKIKPKGLIASISIKDVAKFMVDQIENQEWIKKKVAISY